MKNQFVYNIKKKECSIMITIIENGIKKVCSVEEAENIITNFRKRNGIFSIDETWKIQKVIYLNDSLYSNNLH